MQAHLCVRDAIQPTDVQQTAEVAHVKLVGMPGVDTPALTSIDYGEEQCRLSTR